MLGDMSGGRHRPPEVVPWSNARQAAPLRLQRTVEEALRTENLSPRSNSGLWTQLVHRGLPATIGEQGEINQGGVARRAAVGRRHEPAGRRHPIDAARLRGLRPRRAAQPARARRAHRRRSDRSCPGFVVAGQVMPAWAMRILILAIVAARCSAAR